MIRQKLLQIRKLEYRRPRLASAITIAFEVDGELFLGSSSDISESGICARFGRDIAVGASGLLTLHHHDGTVTRRARIAYLDGLTVGLTFLPDDPCGSPHKLALVRKPSCTV